MNYLGPKLYGNFRRKTPKRAPAASRRDGMSEAYLAALRRMPSCVSGRRPCVPHHLRCGPAAAERGVALKATDRWAVPLTEEEHTRAVDCVHSVGARREEKWFADRGVPDVIALARSLWSARDDLHLMAEVLK